MAQQTLTLPADIVSVVTGICDKIKSASQEGASSGTFIVTIHEITKAGAVDSGFATEAHNKRDRVVNVTGYTSSASATSFTVKNTGQEVKHKIDGTSLKIIIGSTIQANVAIDHTANTINVTGITGLKLDLPSPLPDVTIQAIKINTQNANTTITTS